MLYFCLSLLFPPPPSLSFPSLYLSASLLLSHTGSITPFQPLLSLLYIHAFTSFFCSLSYFTPVPSLLPSILFCSAYACILPYFRSYRVQILANSPRPKHTIHTWTFGRHGATCRERNQQLIWLTDWNFDDFTPSYGALIWWVVYALYLYQWLELITCINLTSSAIVIFCLWI